MTRRLALLYRIAALALLCAVLLGVFALYGRADFLVQLSNQLWGCF